MLPLHVVDSSTARPRLIIMNNPVSIITNAAYIAVGITLLPTVVPVGVALILLGVASFIYHGTGVYWAQKADEIMIYGVLWSFIGWQLSGDPVFTGVFASVLTGYMGFTHKAWDSYKTVPLIFGLLVFIRVWQMEPLMFVVPFLLGTFFAVVGLSEDVSEDVPHGLWHLLTAYGFYMI